jgi:hypothetical protein
MSPVIVLSSAMCLVIGLLLGGFIVASVALKREDGA